MVCEVGQEGEIPKVMITICNPIKDEIGKKRRYEEAFEEGE